MGPRLLVVDDDPADLRIIGDAVKDAHPDVEVDTVSSGADVLAYLKGQRPDLILLDLNMPGMNGFEVLETLKSDESTRSIPVVILTTSDNPRDMQGAYQRYANAYVTKSFDLDTFIRTIEDTLTFWFERTRLLRA